MGRWGVLSLRVGAVIFAGLRALMPQGGTSQFGLGLDFAVLFCTMVVLVGIASRLYPRVAQ